MRSRQAGAGRWLPWGVGAASAAQSWENGLQLLRARSRDSWRDRLCGRHRTGCAIGAPALEVELAARSMRVGARA